MFNTEEQTRNQLLRSLDLLSRQRKDLNFLAHCLTSTYRENAERQRAAVDTRIESLQQKLRPSGS